MSSGEQAPRDPRETRRVARRKENKEVKEFYRGSSSSRRVVRLLSYPDLPRPWPPSPSRLPRAPARPSSRPVSLVRETKISLRSALVLADIRIVSRRPASESADLDCAGTKRNGISGHSMLVYGKLQAISSVAKRHRRRRASFRCSSPANCTRHRATSSASRLFLPSAARRAAAFPGVVDALRLTRIARPRTLLSVRYAR